MDFSRRDCNESADEIEMSLLLDSTENAHSRRVTIVVAIFIKLHQFEIGRKKKEISFLPPARRWERVR